MASIKRSSSRRKFNRDRIDIDELMKASSFSGIRDVIESHFSKPDTASIDTGDAAAGSFAVETDPTRLQFAWEPQQVPFCVRFAAELVERLERESLEIFRAVTHRGSEIGAILLGQVTPSRPPLTVIVEDYEPFICSYSNGPNYILNDKEIDGLKSAVSRRKSAGGLSVVGFFRSNTRSSLALQDEDVSLFEELFPEAHCIFALVKPFSRKPCQGAVFVREGTFVKADASYLEFPFSKAELEKAGALVPAIRVVRQTATMTTAFGPDRVTIIHSEPVVMDSERLGPVPAPDQPKIVDRLQAPAVPSAVPEREEIASPTAEQHPLETVSGSGPKLVVPKAATPAETKAIVPPVIAAGPSAATERKALPAPTSRLSTSLIPDATPLAAKPEANIPSPIETRKEVPAAEAKAPPVIATTPLPSPVPPAAEPKTTAPIKEAQPPAASGEAMAAPPAPEPAAEGKPAPKVRWTPSFKPRGGPLFPTRTVPDQTTVAGSGGQAAAMKPVQPEPAEAAPVTSPANAWPKPEAKAEPAIKAEVRIEAKPNVVTSAAKPTAAVQANAPKFDPAPLTTTLKVESHTQARVEAKVTPVVKPSVQPAPAAKPAVQPAVVAKPAVQPVSSAKPAVQPAPKRENREVSAALQASPAAPKTESEPEAVRPMPKVAAPADSLEKLFASPASAPAPDVYFKVEPEPSTRPAWLLPAIVAAVIAIAITLFVVLRPSHPAVTTIAPAAPIAPATQPLAVELRAEATAEGLVVQWNGSAPQIVSASRGWIAMKDGDVQMKYALTPFDLKSGAYSYKPRTNDVTVQLELEHLNSAQHDLGMIRLLDAKRVKTPPVAPPATHKKKR